MNSNGFTKRNVFIGDVIITEDLTVDTINNGGFLTNPLTTDLDMSSNNIINNPQIDNLQDKTQNISVNGFNETEFSTSIVVDGKITNNNTIQTTDVKCNNLNATTSITAPQITTLQNKTQYLTASGNTSTFTGDVKVTNILNSLILGVGIAQPQSQGYNFPLSRPLTAGQVMVTPAATGNTLSFRSANLDGILNQSCVLNVSTTFIGSVFIGGGAYQLPSTGPSLANQYLVFSGSGVGSFTSQPNPTYGRISRTNSVTGVISLTTATFYPASALGVGIFTTVHEKTADITTNLTTGVITYTGPPKILTLSSSIRVSVSGGAVGNTFNFYLINASTNAIILRDTAFLQAANTRFQLNLSYTQLVATNFALSFAVMPDANANATFSSLQLAMNP